MEPWMILGLLAALAGAALWPRDSAARKQAHDRAYAVACSTLHLTYEARQVVSQTGTATARREAANMNATYDAEARRAHQRSTVPAILWGDNDRIEQAVVRFPPTVDTSPDSKARRAFEALWAERFPDTEWAYAWHPDRVDLTAVERTDLPVLVPWAGTEAEGGRFYLGESDSGSVWWDVGVFPHMLLAGSTRAGKSALLRLLTVQVLRTRWLLAACDPKMVDFAWVQRRPGVLGYETATPQMLALLRDARADMHARYEAMREAGVVKYERWTDPPPRRMVVIDEAYDLLATEGTTGTEKEQRTEAFAVVRELAQKGAGAGVHLIVATQQPYAYVIKGTLRDNLLARVAVGDMRREQSLMALDALDATATPKGVPGRAVARLGDYVPFQIAWLDEDEVDEWVLPPAPAPPEPPPAPEPAPAHEPPVEADRPAPAGRFAADR